MGINVANSGVSAFGAEDKPAEAVTSMDALSTFLESGALLVVAALVVSAFLIFQFGRWFLTRPAPEDEVPEVKPQKMQATPEPDDAGGDEVAAKVQRPWQVQQ